MNVLPAKAGGAPPAGSKAPHDEVRDRRGIAQAVRMMAGAVLDHHRDPAAQLLIDAFDGSVWLPRMGSRLPQTCKQGHVALGQLAELHQTFPADRGIVGVDAGNLVGVGGGPGVGVAPAPAHADEGRLLGQPMLFGEEGVPGVPLLAGIGQDEADVKTALEQLDLGLGLVVEVIAAPGPRVAGGRLLRNDHDAPQLALHLALDPVFFVRGRLDRLDGQVGLVHQEVVAVEPVPGSLLAREGKGCVGRYSAERMVNDGLPGDFLEQAIDLGVPFRLLGLRKTAGSGNPTGVRLYITAKWT